MSLPEAFLYQQMMRQQMSSANQRKLSAQQQMGMANARPGCFSPREFITPEPIPGTGQVVLTTKPPEEKPLNAYDEFCGLMNDMAAIGIREVTLVWPGERIAKVMKMLANRAVLGAPLLGRDFTWQSAHGEMRVHLRAEGSDV